MRARTGGDAVHIAMNQAIIIIGKIMSNPKKLLLLNGPNLNLLGTREPHLYGTATLADIERRLVDVGAELGVTVSCLQSNHEGELIDLISGIALGKSQNDARDVLGRTASRCRSILMMVRRWPSRSRRERSPTSPSRLQSRSAPG